MILAFDDVGPGPAVVLLHGFPLDHNMWFYQRGALGSIYRLILPDLAGFGASPTPLGPATIDAMADDVLETLDHLGLDTPVVLGGLSMGGYVALSLMERAPERFRALILLDTKATPDTPEVARNRETQAQEVLSAGSAASLVATMIPRLFAAGTIQKHPEIVAPVADTIRRTDPAGVAAALRAMATRPDRSGILGSIRIPTLVLGGTQDAITPPDVMRDLASAIPSSQYREVPNSGHMSPLENPEYVNTAIQTFFTDSGIN